MTLRAQLPLLRSLRAADAGRRGEDLLAGVMTAVLLVPQGLAYAMLAGLPAEVGLWACLLPPVVYALFGTSRTLAVGPVAVAALMVADALAGFSAEAGQWRTAAIILAAEAGLVLLAMRALRLGALTHFISHPVLYGFTAGAAVLIVISQVGPLIGPATIEQWATAPWPATLLLGGGSLLVLLLGRWLLPAAAARALPLVLVLGAAALSAWLADPGIAVVGRLEMALPRPGSGLWDLEAWRALLPSAALIALVAYVESVSVARVLAARRRQKIDPDQELTALGLANLAAAGVASMPVAGGFSRSVVNAEAGARTQLASIVTAVVVAALVLSLGGLFEVLPRCVLAAIIIVAVMQLVDLSTVRGVFAYDRGDGLTLLATFGGVLLLGIEAGLVLGIVLSLALYLRQSSQPHLAVVGRVPGTEHFRNIERHAVQCTPGLLILRVDANLFFANITLVEEWAEARIAAEPEPPAKVLLVMSSVSYIDTSAEEALELWEQQLRGRGIELHLAEVKGPVMDRLRDAPLGRALAGRIHLSTHQAVEALQ